MEPPQNPAGPHQPEMDYGPEKRSELIGIIENAPRALRQAVAGLSDAQLDTKYRNWTIRQIAHHLPDSHVNCYMRFKLALTEDVPTIKPYDEGKWAELPDSRTGDVQAALALMDGVHAAWVLLLRSMTDEQYLRSFYHPESGKTIRLDAALSSYAWHCRHHTAQINWVRAQNGW